MRSQTQRVETPTFAHPSFDTSILRHSAGRSAGQIRDKGSVPSEPQESTGSRLVIVTEVKAQYEWDEVEALFADAGPTTADEVSITDDGRRLDSADAVRAFFDEVRSGRVAAAGG